MQRSCGDSSNLVPAKCQRLVFCDTHPLCLPQHPVIVSGQANVVDQPSGLRQSPAPTKTSLILLPWWTAHNSRVPHCLRQVEQIASCPGGESSQGAKRAKPSAAPHKPRKMSKFRWIRSTPYTLPPLCLILGGRGSRLFAVWEFEQTKLFACWCIYSECNGPAGGREGYVDLAAKCQTCVAASLLATHELQELFSASPPIMFEIKSWHGYWI